jgi:hypothetical protein
MGGDNGKKTRGGAPPPPPPPHPHPHPQQHTPLAASRQTRAADKPKRKAPSNAQPKERCSICEQTDTLSNMIAACPPCYKKYDTAVVHSKCILHLLSSRDTETIPKYVCFRGPQSLPLDNEY